MPLGLGSQERKGTLVTLVPTMTCRSPGTKNEQSAYSQSIVRMHCKVDLRTKAESKNLLSHKIWPKRDTLKILLELSTSEFWETDVHRAEGTDPTAGHTCSKSLRTLRTLRGWQCCQSWKPTSSRRCGGLQCLSWMHGQPAGLAPTGSAGMTQWCCSGAATQPSALLLERESCQTTCLIRQKKNQNCAQGP